MCHGYNRYLRRRGMMVATPLEWPPASPRQTPCAPHVGSGTCSGAPPTLVLVTSVMADPRPTTVNIPYRALVDPELIDAERVTLMLLYGLADNFGVIDQTALTLKDLRFTCGNTMRRHLVKLEYLEYIVALNKATQLLRTPLRQSAEGYALRCRANGRRWHSTSMVMRSTGG